MYSYVNKKKDVQTKPAFSKAKIKNNKKSSLKLPGKQEKVILTNKLVVQREGYTVKELIEKIKNNKNVSQGLCNALAAAWLAGKLNASSDTTGVTDENWKILVNLKMFLDLVKYNSGYIPGGIIMIFLKYLEDKENTAQAWLKDLPNKDKYKEEKNFRNWRENNEEGLIEYNNKIIEKGVEVKYNNLDKSAISKTINEALDNNFNNSASFKGIVTIKFINSKNNNYMYNNNGHQFAIKYDSDSNYFSIYDQNTCLRQNEVKNDNEIVKNINNYIIDTYLSNKIEFTKEIEGNKESFTCDQLQIFFTINYN